MIDRTVIQQVRASQAARRSKSVGDSAEWVVRARLILKGLAMVERIETGWTVIRGRGGKVMDFHPNAPVSGDFRAVATGGQSVLVEVKWRPERLIWSDLAPHQRRALDAHHAFGGLSLLGWVYPGGASILRWPVPGFMPGSGIDLTAAAALEWSP